MVPVADGNPVLIRARQQASRGRGVDSYSHLRSAPASIAGAEMPLRSSESLQPDAVTLLDCQSMRRIHELEVRTAPDRLCPYREFQAHCAGAERNRRVQPSAEGFSYSRPSVFHIAFIRTKSGSPTCARTPQMNQLRLRIAATAEST